MATFVRYEPSGQWALYLRFCGLLVWVADFRSRSEALAAASGIDGLP